MELSRVVRWRLQRATAVASVACQGQGRTSTGNLSSCPVFVIDGSCLCVTTEGHGPNTIDQVSIHRLESMVRSGVRSLYSSNHPPDTPQCLPAEYRKFQLRRDAAAVLLPQTSSHGTAVRYRSGGTSGHHLAAPRFAVANSQPGGASREARHGSFDISAPAYSFGAVVIPRYRGARSLGRASCDLTSRQRYSVLITSR